MNTDIEEYQNLFHRETDLINQRITQLIGSQSLIFAGYAVLLTVDKDKIIANGYEDIWKSSVHWLPYLGQIISVLIAIGILSAIIASIILKYKYDKKLGVHWFPTTGGWISAFCFPMVFFFVWSKICDCILFI